MSFFEKTRLSNINGDAINPATEEKQDSIILAVNGYNFIQSEEGVTYKYYGFCSLLGWQVKRKTLATGVWEIAYGDFLGSYADYDAAWADKENLTYTYA